MNSALGFMLVVGVLCGAIGGCGFLLKRAACHAKLAGTGHAAQFGILSGCRLNKDGRWIPLQNWRDFE